MLRYAGLTLLALHAAVDAQTVSLHGSGTTNPKKLLWCAPWRRETLAWLLLSAWLEIALCARGERGLCAASPPTPRSALPEPRLAPCLPEPALTRRMSVSRRQLGSKLEAMAGQPVDISYRAIGSSSGKAEFLAKTSAYGCAEIPVLESEKTAGAQQKPVLLRRERVCS